MNETIKYCKYPVADSLSSHSHVLMETVKASHTGNLCMEVQEMQQCELEMQQAEEAFHLMEEIRQKLESAYQEIIFF